MYRWFERVGYATDLTQLQRKFPAPTDFESYLHNHDWAESANSASDLQDSAIFVTQH